MLKKADTHTVHLTKGLWALEIWFWLQLLLAAVWHCSSLLLLQRVIAWVIHLLLEWHAWQSWGRRQRASCAAAAASVAAARGAVLHGGVLPLHL
jgi:hypothetical protein